MNMISFFSLVSGAILIGIGVDSYTVGLGVYAMGLALLFRNN
jgi:hypothetical protein